MGSEIVRLQEKLVYSEPDNPWVRLYFDYVQFPNGARGRYNKIVEGSGVPGVAILPISKLGIGLVRQYRYAISEYVWEIPRGYADSANALQDAKRELQEETGLSATELISLGSIHPNSAVFATRVELFAAKCQADQASAITDAQEQVQFRWFGVKETLELAEGEITDAMTLAALLRARLKYLL